MVDLRTKYAGTEAATRPYHTMSTPSGHSMDKWAAVPVPAGNESALPATHVTSKDILVVDDEPYLLDLVTDVLEAEGHTARKATNGLEALACIRERVPDLVLLDLMMPVMDGWEFAAALKSNPEWARIPIVIITADYHAARAQQETGARGVITKPFDIDQLADAVQTYTE